jgi:hypothetical protein
VWTDWAAHRDEIGKPLKPTTTKHQLTQLATWNHAGHDPNAIIRRSIARGWTGLFEPEPERDGGSLARRDRVQQDRDNPSAAYQRNAAIILAAIDP